MRVLRRCPQVREVSGLGAGVAHAFVGRTRGGVHQLKNGLKLVDATAAAAGAATLCGNSTGAGGIGGADANARLVLGGAETAATASTASLLLGNAEQSATLARLASRLWTAASGVGDSDNSADKSLPAVLATLQRSVRTLASSVKRHKVGRCVCVCMCSWAG